AILGAVVAELQGNSALAGGLGAAASERGAEIIAGMLYPGKSVDKLSQDEKQQISALAQLATALAVAAGGGDIQDINTAVAGGKNAVENNRLTTPKENKRLDELAKGNAEEKLRYQAAACALVHCSKELADDDPNKKLLENLEALGNSDELQSYRETLQQQEQINNVQLPNYLTGGSTEYYQTVSQLFEYTYGDNIKDIANYINNQYSISTRASGAFQMGVAFIEGSGAIALSPLCSSFIGCGPSIYLSWSATDNGLTGLRVFIEGKSHTTQTGKELAKLLDISEADGDLLFNAASGLASAKGGINLTNKLASSANKLTQKEIEQIKNGLAANQAKNDSLAGKETTDLTSKYSGNLVKVNKPDPAADALAQRIGGESRVRFTNDIREFDVISDSYVAQTKPALKQLNAAVRNQMKATFEAAKETNRSVYYHFEGQPAQSVINKLNEYSKRYGVKVVIDTKPLNLTK
ncbi:restriction endonuclease fold toxin, partial [Gilliamella sp. B3367]|uniref:restriction endonuclease fold toxin n=1 Tax=Gilliamella sp. B3367 TaxID=2817989 RepID=UPI00226A7A64